VEKFRGSWVNHENHENWHPTKITRYTVVVMYVHDTPNTFQFMVEVASSVNKPEVDMATVAFFILCKEI